METLITRLLLHNWQRKLVAVLTALIIWLFVNHSINDTKTLSNIPLKIVNLPEDMTIGGTLPNGTLARRIALTLTGRKDVIEDLESGDLEVVLDASSATHDEWIVQISKKNLVSLDPNADLVRSISQVSHPELVIKMSRLITTKVPVTVLTPNGTSPAGYEFLDIWPRQFFQTVTGPQEEIENLKMTGLEWEFDLNEITKSDLDSLKSSERDFHNDEISFFIPGKWKKVEIPCLNNSCEEINDPRASLLRVDLLRKQFLTINEPLPIRVYYPLQYLEEVNPKTYPLAVNDQIKKNEGVMIFTPPLFVRDVSSFFLDLVKENMEIAILAAPPGNRQELYWNIEVIAPYDLEDIFVAKLTDESLIAKESDTTDNQETVLRRRFREYLQRLRLYLSPERKLHFKSSYENAQIEVVGF